MALLEFTYDGTTKVITAAENCILQYTLVGGGGGGGGPDTYHGGNGLPGSVVSGEMTLTKGQSVYCSVGQGGRGGGTQGTSRTGGIGGASLDGFSGGTGGRSGWAGSSGAGGGGGGATVLSSSLAQSSIIAVAAGGGAGGGGGNHGGAPTYSTEPYGDTLAYSYRYYSNAATNGAYCSFLNTYGVWNGDGRYSYEVYFPTDGTYTFRLSADNYGYMWLDNGTVNGNNDYIGNTPNSGASDFNQYYNFNHYVTKGWHTVDVYARNWGGPASVGAAIIAPGQTSYMWTTRSSYNPLSVTYNLGRGGHGVDYSGDGGGAGGGGGGYRGGRGGPTRGGDVGGYSGSDGYDYNLYPATVTIGSPSSYGAGGIGYNRPTGGYPGGDGYAALNAIQTDISVKSGSLWKKTKGLYIRDSFSLFGMTLRYWKSVPAMYVRSNGEWKKVYGDLVPAYYSQANSYSSISGPYPG